MRKVARTLAGSVCLVSVMSLAVSFAQTHSADWAYHSFLTDSPWSASIDEATDEARQSSHLAKSLSINDEVVGWLSVENTPISYPVVQPSEAKRHDWYLDHDVDGHWSPLGCPYLDVRSFAEGDHLMVFGHHVHGTDAMFSTIADAYEQPRFDEIGNARWTTVSTHGEAFRPLFALKVDASFQEIQQFGFSDDDEFEGWLADLAEKAEARNPTWRRAIRSATQALTLVTCSSPTSGQPWRTLVIFAR